MKNTKPKPGTKPEEMTYSRIASFLTCPMKEFYQYRAGGKGIESTTPYIPFIEGEFLHYALMHFHKSYRMLRVNLLKRADKIIERVTRSAGGLDPETDDKLRIALAAMTGAALGYKILYHDDQLKFETLYVEEPFQFELEGYIIRGRIDWIARDKETDKLVNWENKSASQISSDTYVALPMSLQDLLYCEGTHMLLGEYPDLRCRNYVIKTKLRRKKDKQGGRETLASYEARVLQQYVDEPEKKFFRPPPLRVLKKTMESVRDQLALNLRRMKAEASMAFNCEGKFGQPCQFVPACTAKLQGHADGWNAPECAGMYRSKEHQHPELVIKKEEDDAKDI